MLPAVSEDEVSAGLRELTRAASLSGHSLSGGLLGGEDGYGAYLSHPRWGMHPYCWCERDDCPWCRACTCPDGAEYFTVDGVRMDDWDAFYDSGGFAGPGVRKIHKVPELACDWCSARVLQAPNFWHVPTGSWVTWYKYIGRDMVIHLNAPWSEILADCLEHMPVAGPHAQILPPPFGPDSSRL